MQFVRMIARTVTVFHQGRVLIEDDVDRVLPTRWCATSISAARSTAAAWRCRHDRGPAGSRPATAASGAARARRSPVAPGSCCRHPRPQRHGQDDAAADPDRPAAGHGRPIALDGADDHAAADPRPRAGSASATCRRGGRSSRRSRCATTSASRVAGTGRRRGGRDRGDPRRVPELKRLLDRPGGALSRRRAATPGAGPGPLRPSPGCCCSTSRPRASSPRSCEAIVERLHGLRRSRGLTVLLVEQNLDFIQALSDRVLLIQRGRIVREMAPAALEAREVLEAFAGVEG